MGRVEEWRPVTALQGYYEVSSFGRIRNADTKRLLKVTPSKIGYPVFTARGWLFTPPKEPRRCYPVYVHMCVAQEFLDNPFSYNEINHKDGNKSNNNVDNLEWCTHAHNMRHAGDIGLCKGCNFKPVLQIKDGIVVGEYPSVGDASRKTGIHATAIGNVANHRVKISDGAHSRTAGGFVWEWKATM